MVILKGNNLNKRHQELNLKVIDTVSKRVYFEEVKADKNVSDVDMLYVIDVASKYKNIKYLIEVLKGGDSLYISKVLKCTWIYNNESSNIINTDYLHCNIFPFMSLKMKRKFLITISAHLRNERAASFYTYCINENLYNIALKFLIFTSETFKLHVIKQNSASLHKIVRQDREYISFLIGKSLILAKAFLDGLSESQRTCALYKLRYLLSICSKGYLDLLEKYQIVDKINIRFGLRISKQILTKRKDRCLQNPLLYMNILNKTVVTRNITADVAKDIAVKLMPLKVETFWSERYCTVYDFILNIIPATEKFQFLTNIFNNKYNGEEFAMTKQFLDSEIYILMTREEREIWALRHIESKKQMQGNGRDFLWYKFIRFDVAFPEIKKHVLKTKDFRTRAEMLKVLIKSSRNHEELEKLLNYYYERHINEASYNITESFITEIIKRHNIFYFDRDWWDVFNKILYSIDIYNIRGYRFNFITFAALVYHIIHNIDIPDILEIFDVYELHWFDVSGVKLYSKVKEKDQQKVYEYLLKRYTDRIGKVNYDSNGKQDDNIPFICAMIALKLLEIHKKNMDDYPKIVKDYIESNWRRFDECDVKYRHLVKDINIITESNLLRYLKQDTKIVIDKIPDVQRRLTDNQNRHFKINQFLKKIKVYFPDDVAKEYQLIFLKMISDKDLPMHCVYSAVYDIFQLADDQFKQHFMREYAPSDSKIDYTKIDRQTLYVQGGICRYACFSRPPVSISKILMYIKGDYLQYCSPIFDTFLANLPVPLYVKFIESIIKSPVSVQKHGIRIAIKSFSGEKLNKMVNGVWNNAKNLSLRLIVYRTLYNKIVDENITTQWELFEILKSLTLHIQEEDLDEIYSLLTSNKLPERLLCEYIEIGWQTVDKFVNSSNSVKHKKSIIINIEQNLPILDVKFVKYIVEEYIADQLVKAEIKNCYEIAELEHLHSAKWKLVTAYMVYFTSDSDIVTKNVELTKLIMNKCLEMWNTLQNDTFVLRRFCWNFVDLLIGRYLNNSNYEDAIPIYETILLILEESLPLQVTYLKCWSLRLTILNRKLMQMGKLKFDKVVEKAKRILIIKEIVKKYAQEIGELIKKSVVNKIYLSSVTGIEDMIISNVNNFKCAIDINDDVGVDNLYVAAVAGLIQNGIPETYLLALSILPTNSLNYGDEDYKSIVNKIRAYENEQVQFCLYQKFVICDFKNRMLDI